MLTKGWCMLLAACFTLSVSAQSKGKPSAKKGVATQKAVVKKTVSPKVNGPWQFVNSKQRLVEINTDYGVMVALLYDATPLHRDNFVKLVQSGFYDSLLFHRVISSFMIQGGDPTSKYAADGQQLGSGSAPGERIPAEFRPNLFHKKGALAAARDNNPAMASSNCQFYIVQGKRMNEQELEGVYTSRVKPTAPNFVYTPFEKEVYARMGGTPFLDQGYTVFGEIISGLDVIDKIANLPKSPTDRPLQNARMKMRMLN